MKCFFDTCTAAVEYAVESKGFGIFYSDIKNQNPNVHIHDCCEIFLCLRGGSSFLIDGKIWDIADGDLLMINQFEAHKVVPGKDACFERYIMHVHPSFLHASSSAAVDLSACFYAANRATKITLSHEEISRLVALFLSLREERSYGDELYKRLRGTELLLEVSGLFAAHRDSAAFKCSHRTVQLAINYINEAYVQPLTLETVAKNAFVSPAHLTRLFQRYCGTTVTKYIISKRIAEAKKLLGEGKSVTDTAFLCGFNDYANFIRAFKRAVGVPPGKYRKLE